MIGTDGQTEQDWDSALERELAKFEAAQPGTTEIESIRARMAKREIEQQADAKELARLLMLETEKGESHSGATQTSIAP